MPLLPMISIFLLSITSFQDQAERLYDNAQTFMNAGKYREALADLETVVQNFNQTPWAARALLAMGNYYLEIEADHDRAADYFARIQKEYSQSEVAPAAYYYKALIVEDKGESPEELEAAVADLIRMSSLYPGNPWRNGALFLFGKLAMRLQLFDESLSYFQRLEFNFPNSAFVPQTLLLSAKVAYLKGDAGQAAAILARLQAKHPNAEEFKTAANFLRLLDRFQRSGASLEVDANFFGATPKKFQNPSEIVITENQLVGIMDQKGAYFATLELNAPMETVSSRDLVGFGSRRGRGILLVYENRITARDGVPLPAVDYPNGSIREIKSATVDAYGRMLLIDGNAKDLLAFSREGRFLKSFGFNKPKRVRCFGGEIWVLTGDGALARYGADFNYVGPGVPKLASVIDFQLDPFGNIYVLADRGYSVAVFTRSGTPHLTINLKSGAFPLKQAQAIGVDASGAIYLADRRGGSVFRFH